VADQSDLIPEDFTVQTRLAILENVVRMCVARGATETQVREAVEYAIATPEEEERDDT
jgi:hypothetical protein